MVVRDELTPPFRDTDVFIPYVIEQVFQRAVKIPIPLHHMEHSITRETVHSTRVSAFLFRVDFGPLLMMVVARCVLAAFVCSPDSSIRLGVFPLEPN